MQRTGLAVVAILLGGALLAGCDDAGSGSPAAPSATPSATASPGTAAAVSPVIYVLGGKQVAAYQRTDTVVGAATVAGQEGTDPALLTALTAQGYQEGIQRQLAQPVPAATVLPFYQITSSAYIFTGAAGAKAFFDGESARANKPAANSQVTPITNPPAANVDDVLGLQQVNLSSDPNQPQARAYLGLARRGRVVVELFGRINVNTTTVNDFTTLLAAQEALLSVLPS